MNKPKNINERTIFVVDDSEATNAACSARSSLISWSSRGTPIGPKAEVTVAELIPEVVDWNRGDLGDFSGRPMDDPRTRIHIGDVAKLLRSSHGKFDVIALDVDNGPEGLTKSANDWLYSMSGIAVAQKALTPTGILAYWSADPDPAFHDRLRLCGFMVEEVSVFAHGKKGTRHTIWLARV